MALMLTRLAICLALCTQLSACIITPRFEVTEKLNFDYVPVSAQPMSYNDLLCCEQCTV